MDFKTKMNWFLSTLGIFSASELPRSVHWPRRVEFLSTQLTKLKQANFIQQVWTLWLKLSFKRSLINDVTQIFRPLSPSCLAFSLRLLNTVVKKSLTLNPYGLFWRHPLNLLQNIFCDGSCYPYMTSNILKMIRLFSLLCQCLEIIPYSLSNHCSHNTWRHLWMAPKLNKFRHDSNFVLFPTQTLRRSWHQRVVARSSCMTWHQWSVEVFTTFSLLTKKIQVIQRLLNIQVKLR